MRALLALCNIAVCLLIVSAESAAIMVRCVTDKPVKYTWSCTGPVTKVEEDVITVDAFDTVLVSGFKGEPQTDLSDRRLRVMAGDAVKLRLKERPAQAGTKIVINDDLCELYDQGKMVLRVTRRDDKRLRSFRMHPSLAESLSETEDGGAFSYRFSDVRVKDFVHLNYVRIEEEDLVTGVCIMRRPNGRVPSGRNTLPERLRSVGESWSDRMNAEQAWEEHGTPVPSRFLDRHGRGDHLNPPYPPSAPAPRISRRDTSPGF